MLAGRFLDLPEVKLPTAMPLRDDSEVRHFFARVGCDKGVLLGKALGNTPGMFYSTGPGSKEQKNDVQFQVLLLNCIDL